MKNRLIAHIVSIWLVAIVIAGCGGGTHQQQSHPSQRTAGPTEGGTSLLTEQQALEIAKREAEKIRATTNVNIPKDAKTQIKFQNAKYTIIFLMPPPPPGKVLVDGFYATMVVDAKTGAVKVLGGE